MRRNLGWISVILPPLAGLVVSTLRPVGTPYLLSEPRGRVLFAIAVFSLAAGFVALLYTPFRTPALKWISAPIYLALMPLIMMAIEVAINGLNIGS